MKLISFISKGACFATVLAFLLGSADPALAGKKNLLVLDVETFLSSLNLVENPAGSGEGPFYIAGEIFKPNTNTKIGDFHCWGFSIEDGTRTVVSQEYNLFGRGKIQVQGSEGRRAVTGGTGRFRNVRGEMTGTDLCNSPEFTVKFRLIGAGSGKKEKK